MDKGLNHSEIVNMVSEGVQTALVKHETTEQVNNTKETDNLCAQLNEIRELIEKVNNAQHKQQNAQQQQPFQVNPYMYQNKYQNQHQIQYQNKYQPYFQ